MLERSAFIRQKNLGGYGDGGMVVTNSRAVAEQVRLLRAHGSRERYHHLAVGINSRLDELQAAILRVKLRHLDRWNAVRHRYAQQYAKVFEQHGQHGIVLPKEQPGCRSVYHLYTIRHPHRARIQQYLAKQGIDSQVAYPSTLPAQPALRGGKRSTARFPLAEQAAQQVLALPIYPELTSKALHAIVRTTCRSFQQLKRSA